MCGICGIYHLDHQPVEAVVLKRMTDAIAHRGPDGEGYHCDEGGIGLGFRRLAIIDLTTGDQPIYSEDRQIVTIFNGEIYNYKALRAELEATGHQFASHADTEVLVHGYEEWGDGLLHRLRGMYAFAIWDRPQQRLLLVRDRLGQKPLYYAQWGQTLVFGSEIKALLQHPLAQRRLNQAALPEYLLLGYTRPPRTLFEGIMKLAPGSYLSVDRAGQLHTAIYWQPHLTPDTTSYADQQQRLRACLEEVVQMQLMSDVPLGTFLSGGVDSTTITALTGRMTGQPVESFTVGFDFTEGSGGDKKFNVDLHVARRAANALQTHHHEIVLHQNSLIAEFLPQLVYALDEPSSEFSIVQTVFVAALARAHNVPVLLSGDGADEVFAGYNFFKQDHRVSLYQQWLPGFIREQALPPLADRLPARFSAISQLIRKGTLSDPAERFLTWHADHKVEMLRQMVHEEHDLRGTLQDINRTLSEIPAASMTEKVGYGRLRQWLAESSNLRVDKMSMWMSIETRSPFEDHELVQLGLNIPMKHKLPNDGKAILKDAVADLIPAEVRQRPKWGFIPPTSDWLRTILRPLVDTYMAPQRMDMLGINGAFVQQMIANHMTRAAYHMPQLQNLLILQLWHAIFIEDSLTVGDRWSAQELVERSRG